jgi:hypothetical protein
MSSYSLHGRYGGKQSTDVHEPSESEALALVAGCATHWCKLRRSDHPDFFKLVAQQVKDLEATSQLWTRKEIVKLFHNRVLGGIGQEGLKRYLQKNLAGLAGDELDAATREFVASIIYRFFASAKGGVHPEAAMALAKKAELESVLHCKIIGGNPAWDIAEFVNPEVWAACGEQAGMAQVSRKFMTLLACGARDPPINPICPDCEELTCMHSGDRLNVKVIACACQREAASAANASKRKAPEDKGTQGGAKRRPTKSFEAELDPNGAHNMSRIYNERIEKIKKRYPETEPKAILKKLLGKDVSVDDPIPDGRASSSSSDVGVTGEQGGRLLACYLFHLECDTGTSEDISDILQVESAEQWLAKAEPRVLLMPAARLCVQKAKAFLPKLKAGLRAAAESSPDEEGDFGDLFE